jgi:hypothetical protein
MLTGLPGGDNRSPARSRPARNPMGRSGAWSRLTAAAPASASTNAVGRASVLRQSGSVANEIRTFPRRCPRGTSGDRDS